jgi:hypothetical protein
MTLPVLDDDDPRELVRLDAPDPLGAVAWVYVFTNDTGDMVPREEATHYSADGFDASGNRVAGEHGILDDEDE